jgi:NADPH:quinone reductase
VRHAGDLAKVDTSVLSHCVALDQPDAASVIRRHAPDGVDRIVEVDFSGNAELDSAVVANGAVIAAYASGADRPELPFWPMLFANVTVRLLGSDDFSAASKQQAGADLTTAAQTGALHIRVAPVYPLAQIAASHDDVDHGPRNGRIVVAIPA